MTYRNTGSEVRQSRSKKARRTILLVALTVGLIGAWSPTAKPAFPGANGKIVFFSNQEDPLGGQYDIWRMKPDGTNRVQLTDDASFDADPAFSPNGQRIAFTKSGELYVMGANGNNPQGLVVTGEDLSWINNNRILYSTGESGDIWTIKADGNDAQVVKATTPGESEPDWSKATGRIVFVRYDGNDDEIFTMKLDGTGVRQLTHTNFVNEDDPDWAPDGSRIAYSRFPFGGSSDVYSMKPNGKDRKRLTDSANADEEPAYSPDMSFIAFETNRNGGDDEIWKMRANGRRERKITSNDFEDDNPDWQPLH